MEGPHTSLHPGADSPLIFASSARLLVDVIVNETNRYAVSKGRKLSVCRDESGRSLALLS